MCYNYNIVKEKAQWNLLKDIGEAFSNTNLLYGDYLMIRGFDYGNIPVLRKKETGNIVLENMHWEFIPHWIKTNHDLTEARKQGIPWLNARGETLLTSKMFKNAALTRRCLIPASWFFESRHYKPDGAKKPVTYPYAITTADEKGFLMAGIWQPFTDLQTGETFNTVALVTTAANELMEIIHNTRRRMPVILPNAEALQWIDEATDLDTIHQLACFQISSNDLYAYTIPKDYKTSIHPLAVFEYDELPPLDLVT